MPINYKMQGRAELTRRLERLVPGVTENVAKAKLEVAQEAAAKMRAAAPHGETGEYAASIVGERQADNPNQRAVGHRKSEDPDATGIYADWKWNFIEFGTKPHKIKAKAAPELVFRGKNGNLVRKAEVQHPGARKQPHIFPTWRSYRKKARRKIANAINKYIREDIRKK